MNSTLGSGSQDKPLAGSICGRSDWKAGLEGGIILSWKRGSGLKPATLSEYACTSITALLKSETDVDWNCSVRLLHSFTLVFGPQRGASKRWSYASRMIRGTRSAWTTCTFLGLRPLRPGGFCCREAPEGNGAQFGLAVEKSKELIWKGSLIALTQQYQN